MNRHGRNYFLSDIPLDEAWGKFRDALGSAGTLGRMDSETVPLQDARGRVTADPVWAKISSPHYDAAAMDGIAVRASETIGATETSPLRLTVDEQAVWVDTGDPMPDGFNAVIMVEVVHEIDSSTIEIQDPAAPYQHVRPLGEDIVATELVLPENHIMRPVDLGACAAAGLSELAVRRSPMVAIIPTGSELVNVGDTIKPGDIIEFNSLVLAGMAEEWGAQPTRFSSVPDDYERLKSVIFDASKAYDIVVVNAGSSAGSEDYTARLVEELGELLVHGVAIRPGHPVVLGIVNGKPILGIPGYAVSAALTCELFLKPVVEMKLGAGPAARDRTSAVVTRKVLSPIGEDEFLRVRLGRVGKRLVATPLPRGAGVISSLVRADGIVKIPRFSEGFDAGHETEVELLRSMDDVEGTIVAIGSHDLTLDLLSSHLSKGQTGLSLASSNVGSLGGITALARGEAHMAGSHLLDEETGEYNISYVRQYLPGHEIVVMNLVHRVQGLIVPKGNPKDIKSLEDLASNSVSFINRQRGSGTRVLLDFKLKEMGLSPEEIDGYDREDFTHLAVAAAVAGGRADTGLGILSAANAMDMDFVPLLSEQYDLIIPKEFFEGEKLRPVLEMIRSNEFRNAVDALGGYDTTSMGKVIAEIP